MNPLSHTSRRSVVAAAAWSVPVVAVAVAAPLAAASGEELTIATPPAVYPGQNYAPIAFTLSPAPATAQTIPLSISGTASLPAGTSSVSIGTGGTATLAGVVAGTAQSTLTGSYEGTAVPVQLNVLPVPPANNSVNGHSNVGGGAGNGTFSQATIRPSGQSQSQTVRFWIEDTANYAYLVDGVEQPFAYVTESPAGPTVSSPTIVRKAGSTSTSGTWTYANETRYAAFVQY
jgi:hypothetical protein